MEKTLVVEFRAYEVPNSIFNENIQVHLDVKYFYSRQFDDEVLVF